MKLDARQSDAIVASVLGAAKKLDPKAEVHLSLWSARSAHTRFARNEVTSAGDVEDAGLSVTVKLGKRHARASANQMDEASIRELVERAFRMAKVSPEDPESMPVLGAQKYAAVPPGYDAAVESLSARHRAEAVEAALAAGKEGLDVAGFVEHGHSVRMVATSAGARGVHRSSAFELSTTARTPDGTGSGWAAAFSHRASEVKAASVAARAVDKAVRSKKPRPLPPGRYTVVLEPAAVAELLSFLVGALDARQADEGRSFFSAEGGNKVGQKLFSPLVTLRSDPADAAAPSAPFDDEGLALEPVTWVDKGALAALRYSRFWAHKQGKKPTGSHGVYQLLPGTEPVEKLVAGVKRGLLVTRFWYSRWLDPQSLLVTGLTRDGTFLIEDGQVTTPVNNFRYNESVAHLLANVDAVGDEAVRLPFWPSLRVPALRANELHMASVSEAV